MKKLTLVSAFTLVALFIVVSIAAGRAGPNCDSLKRAFEQVPPDSPAYTRLFDMIQEYCVQEFTLTAPLEFERHNHTASLLADGRVMVAGGAIGGWQGPSMVSTEIYDAVSEVWQSGPPLTYQRQDHTATVLSEGQVFVTGGTLTGPVWQDTTEMLDPELMLWEVKAPLSYPRSMHSATLLPDGQILVVGGWTGATTLAHIEAYDPVYDTWHPAGSLLEARHDHSATLLPDGRVLIVGGYRGMWLTTAEIFDPSDGTSTQTNPLFCHGTSHQAVQLADGRVLVVGGACGGGSPGIVAQAEIFDPATDSWQAVDPMAQARFGMTATRLVDGRIIVIGGGDGNIALASAEIFNPDTGTWEAASQMNMARVAHKTTLLPDNRLLVTGGWASDTITLNSVEIYE